MEFILWFETYYLYQMHNSEWKLAMLDYVETKRSFMAKKKGLKTNLASNPCKNLED